MQDFKHFYEPVYEDQFPITQYYTSLFSAIPSYYVDKKLYSYDIIDHIINDGFELHAEINQSKSQYKTNHEQIYVNTKKEIILIINFSSNIEQKLIWYRVYYNRFKGSIDELIPSDFISSQKKEQKTNVSLLVSDMGTLDAEKFIVKPVEIDLELNYGKKFLKIHDVIIKRLNTDNDKGIILLHGPSGTGKTSYIRYLTKLIKRKEILFISPSVAEMIGEPSIIPFLITKKNSILLIEDAERVIGDRENGKSSSIAVSNLLNLTDGILGDCLNIQVIATFNMSREKIDPALLRKSRLICEWKFDYLDIEDSNKLLKKLYPNKNYSTTKSLLLSDIYTFGDEDLSVSNNQKKLGF